MSYRQILATLEALPEGERQLAAWTYSFKDEAGKEVCGCVLGKAIPELRRLSGTDAYGRQWQQIGAERDTFDVAKTSPEAYGLTLHEALCAQDINDRYGSSENKNGPGVRRARYLYMIKWLRARVAEVEVVTSAASAASAAPSIPKFGSPGCAGGNCGKDGGGRND